MGILELKGKKNGVVQMLRKKKERKNETFGEKKKGF